MRPARAYIACAALLLGACARPAPSTRCAERPDLCEQARAFALPAALPAARGNTRADDPRALALGFALFFDSRLSATQEVRCATCHLPESAFDDARPTSRGLADVARNSPTLLNAAWLSAQLWDGRADSLWSQPLFALENEKEMNFTRLELAHRVAFSYRADYEALFGPLPALSDPLRFPAKGKPGDLTFDLMGAADQAAVNQVAANVGKALEAYVRKLAAFESPFERYLEGDADALDAEQVQGLEVFLRAGCDGCHAGPLFTDEGFHNLGVPAAAGAAPDPGRSEAFAVLEGSPFNGQGGFYEGAKLALPSPGPADLGAFRTPPLRNLAQSGPYGHNGSFATLEEVVDFHLAGGGRGQGGFVGEVDARLAAVALSGPEKSALLSFLTALEGRYPPPPWNNWPGR